MVLTSIITTILSLIITFALAGVFSIYHFDSTVTFTTCTYLLFIFCFITYILLAVVYVVNKRLKIDDLFGDDSFV